MATITVDRVDVELLREQRNELLELMTPYREKSQLVTLEGIVNLLDAMLDAADGFPGDD